MCGKFTAMASWREVVASSQPLSAAPDGSETVLYTPMTALPVIIYDRETKQRRIVPMRWGFPHRSDWRRPDPIHARSESIDVRPAFADAFHNGQRGIVVFKTFNEGKELPSGKTEQWTINPGDGLPRGFAFIWRRFALKDIPVPLLACCMVTVEPSELVKRIPADRMPTILEDQDWAAWLGENDASPADVKAVLKTMENVRWTIAPEVKPKKPARVTAPVKPDPDPELF
jgi:putative SOS response-associated peptidase YedK